MSVFFPIDRILAALECRRAASSGDLDSACAGAARPGCRSTALASLDAASSYPWELGCFFGPAGTWEVLAPLNLLCACVSLIVSGKAANDLTIYAAPCLSILLNRYMMDFVGAAGFRKKDLRVL